jgi:hypothetical protein
MTIEIVAWLGWTAALANGVLWLECRAALARERYMREFWEKNFDRIQQGEMPQPRPM